MSTTCPRPRKIPTSSAKKSPSIETCLSDRKQNRTIVRNFEQFCPNCGKSLLSPRVMLKRLSLPVNSQVILEDKIGYKIFSDDLKAVCVFNIDTGLHSPSIKCGPRSVLGRSASCKDPHFDMFQTTISRQNKRSPLKSVNLLTSDLQAPIVLCQDEITQKKNMNLVVNLGKTGSNQFGQQV